MALESFFAENYTADEIKQTKERCDLILECKHQIEYWKSKLEVLEDEQTTFIKLARLRIDACTTWRSLTRRERMEKKFILAALEAPELPSALAEFQSSSFPPHIRLDREILLARVKRSDFGRDPSLFRRSHENQEEDAGVMDRYFFVPPRLRSDKEVILAILPKYPHVIECMASNLRDDEDVLKELLMCHPGSTLPKNFIQHFSDRIRSSPSIMLDVVLKHPSGVPALGFCGQDLRNDKQFILNAISRAKEYSSESETHVLRYASHRLRADRDVVDRAIDQSGLNLKHASYQLRRDRELVVKAAHQNGKAFRYCLPGPVKDELLCDRDFLLQIVESCPNYVFRNCNDDFRNDRELLRKAAIHGLDWVLMPLHLQRDEEFLCQIVRQAPMRYLELHESVREIFTIALAVFQAVDADDDELLEATEQCPQLLSDRDAMWVIANKAKTEIISETIQFSPVSIRSDKELMLQAIKTDSVAFEFCTDELQHDLDIVLAAVPTSLYLVPETYQVEHPDIVRVAIEKTDSSDLWMTYDDICDTLWSNREIAKAWLAKGGDWLNDNFPEEYENDEELLLTVAECNWSEFEFASDALKNDKKFMLRAVGIDGRIIREASEDLRYDYDIALAAFSRDIRALQFFSGAEDFEFMCGFSKWVRQQIEDYKTFTNEFAAKIVKPRATDGACHLGLLNQGPETLSSFLESLVGFLGLPGSERLEMMETASKNMLAWGL